MRLSPIPQRPVGGLMSDTYITDEIRHALNVERDVMVSPSIRY
jgi:osmotically-inducible protein OsmY